MNPARVVVALLFSFRPGFRQGAGRLSLPRAKFRPARDGSFRAAREQFSRNRADIQAVLARQGTRTAADIERAKFEEKASPVDFADVFGPWFTAKNVPRTFALLDDAAADAMAISSSAKDLWHRPRPPLQDSAIHPVLPLPSSYSYPSGHAMRGVLWAEILANLAPDLRGRLLARGELIGQDRVLGGVHFPSDVAAGQKLGAYLAPRFLSNPAFQRDLTAARSEFSGKRPAPGRQTQ